MPKHYHSKNGKHLMAIHHKQFVDGAYEYKPLNRQCLIYLKQTLQGLPLSRFYGSWLWLSGLAHCFSYSYCSHIIDHHYICWHNRMIPCAKVYHNKHMIHKGNIFILTWLLPSSFFNSCNKYSACFAFRLLSNACFCSGMISISSLSTCLCPSAFLLLAHYNFFSKLRF